MHFSQCVSPFFVYNLNKIIAEIKLSKILRKLSKLSLTIKNRSNILCINHKTRENKHEKVYNLSYKIRIKANVKC